MIIEYDKKKLLHFNIYDVSLAVYLCVLLAHQPENRIELLLRYGSLAFVLGVHLVKLLFIDGFEFRYHEFAIWLIALLGYGLLSTLWSIDPINAFSTLKNLLKVSLVCIVLLPRMRTLKDIDRTLMIVLFALCYTVLALMIRTPLSDWGTVRIGGAINQHSNAIGRLANLGLLLSLYFYTAKKKAKPFLLFLMIIFALCAFFTGSKNAIFIMVFQIGLYCYIISNSRKRVLTIVLMIFGILIISWLVMNIPWLYNLVGRRFERMFTFFSPNANNVDGSTSERLYYMKTAWRVFTKHPIAGIGMNNFSAYLKMIGYHNPKYSHCGFVEVLSTLGIIGFVLYYGMFLRIIFMFLKSKLRQNKLLAVLFAHTVCVFVFDISTISMYEYIEYIMLLLAFCASSLAFKQSKHRKTL